VFFCSPAYYLQRKTKIPFIPILGKVLSKRRIGTKVRLRTRGLNNL